MKKLKVCFQKTPGESVEVGTLVERQHQVYFEYASSWLDQGLELSPFKLPLQSGLIEHQDHAFGPLPGVFDDSLPDGWGLLLMDRYFRKQGIEPASISPLDRLAYLGSRTMGALAYYPPAQEVAGVNDEPLDLYAVGRHAEAVLEGDVSDVLPELMRAGGSPGGARPKVLVGLKENQVISGEGELPEGYEPWIVKFSAKHEVRDAGPVEYAYSLMAKEAGLMLPATRLIHVKQGSETRQYFAVQRFDRKMNRQASCHQRIHVHTLGNLIHANFRVPSLDYVQMLKVVQVLTRNHQDVLAMFRQMVFNVAAHNRDDHAKNFAFMLDDKTSEWSLSPAYDLTYAPGPGGEHTATVSGEGLQPTRADCLKVAETFGLKKRETEPIFDQVNHAIEQWPEFAQQAECVEEVVKRIGSKLSLI